MGGKMNRNALHIFLMICLLLTFFLTGTFQSRGEIKVEGKPLVEAEKEKAGEGKILGEMVLLSGGTFWMGMSEKEAEKALNLGKENKIGNAEKITETEMPRHQVTVKPFYIDKYEVTNQQFATFINATGYKPQGEWEMYSTPGREYHPAVAVTWYDAKAYAEWIGKRLPTEAEWEFAARGALEEQLFPWGDEVKEEQACYSTEPIYYYAPIQTMEVGHYAPNSFGLYDMSGNGGEWCADRFDDQYYSESPGENPSGPEQGEKMVVRGGAWGTLPFYLRVSSRGSFEPGRYDYRIGFRCARSMD
jgi:iron(II)-dependent oxidoreductase